MSWNCKIGELVTDTVHGLDEAGVFGVGLDLGAKHSDVVIDGAGGGEGSVAPDGIEELFAGDGRAGVFGEEAEDGEFLGGAVEGFGCFVGADWLVGLCFLVEDSAHCLGGKIDLNIAELELVEG